MSSTTPSATRNSASLDKLQVEKGRLWSTGRLSATFLISRRSGRVNFGGRPPEYFAANESNPSALKLWMTSLTRSSEVKAILAMAGTSILWADQSTIWALRHRTTEPDPRRTIERSLRPSSLVISLTATRSAMAPLCATSRSKWWTRAPNVAGHGTSASDWETESTMSVSTASDARLVDIVDLPFTLRRGRTTTHGLRSMGMSSRAMAQF